MNVASRPVSTGKTRTCPHCKATILESLSICPGCMHHLRFDSEAAKRQVAAAPALRVEGIIRHPPLEQPLEYYVIIAIRNDRGEEVTRQVVNVGALQAAEKRTFTLSVEVLPPAAPVPPKPTGATGTFKAPTQSAATVKPNPQAPPTTGSTSSGTSSTGTYSTGASGTGAPGTGAPGAGASGSGAPGASSAGDAAGSPGNVAGSPAGGRGSVPGRGAVGPVKPTGYPGGLKPPNPGGPKRH